MKLLFESYQSFIGDELIGGEAVMEFHHIHILRSHPCRGGGGGGGEGGEEEEEEVAEAGGCLW